MDMHQEMYWDQEVWIDADAFTRADAESIPTGEITPVEGTPMDFRTKKSNWQRNRDRL